MIGAIVGAVGKVAGQWLGNRKAKADAESNLAIAELNARASVAERKAEYELDSLRQTSSLDLLAVKEAAKSWFDEFLCLLFLAPGILASIGACFGNGYAMWGLAIFASMEAMPVWYQVVLGLLLVRYLGFRGLLRAWISGKVKLPFKPTWKETNQ